MMFPLKYVGKQASARDPFNFTSINGCFVSFRVTVMEARKKN